MASAIPAFAAPPDEASNVPSAWWRRGHTYATPVVVAGDLGLAWLAIFLTRQITGPTIWQDVASAAVVGFLIAKCFLLGLWAALGSPRTVPRWLLVGGLGFVGATAIGSRFFEDNPEPDARVALLLQIGLITWIVSAGFAAVLLPLRRLAGWRVDFDAAYHPDTGQRRGQMGLMDFAAMSCAVALPLTLSRCLIDIDDRGDAASSLLSILLLGSLILMTAAPAAYAALVRLRTWLWILAAALWIFIVAAGQSLLATLVPDLDIFGGSRPWGLDFTPFALHTGAALAVGVPLAVLRGFGLKILTVK